MGLGCLDSSRIQHTTFVKLNPFQVHGFYQPGIQQKERFSLEHFTRFGADVQPGGTFRLELSPAATEQRATEAIRGSHLSP